MRQIKTQLPLSKSPPITPSNKQNSTIHSRSLWNYKKYLKPALSQEQVKQIKQIFDIFDTQGRGLVDPQQLLQSLDSIGYKNKQNTVYQQFLNLAADGYGEIEFSKFLTMLTTKVTQHDSRQDMNQLFTLFDDQKSGYLTIKTLRRIVREMGIQIQQRQLQKMIEVADGDRDGRVSEEEFYWFMTSKKEDQVNI